MTTTVPNTDLNSLSFWARSAYERDAGFAWLRAHDPVAWHGAPDPISPDLPNEAGFWSLTKHPDIRYVSRNPQLFSSAHGVFIDDFPQLETILSFIVMDPPQHTALRGIVNSTFTPRNIRRMEDDIRATVADVVADMKHQRAGDLCEVLAKQIPGRIFAGFMGVSDRDQRQAIMDASEQLGAWADPEYAHRGTPLEVFVDAADRLKAICADMAVERRIRPGDDLLSWILQADFEGRKMDEAEFGAFFCLLSGGANDTSRHSIAHALIELDRHPEQRDWLYADFEKRADLAVNELLRWKAPLMHFRRVANQDIELRGKTIRAGDKLALWYVSGNRDEEVFDDPFTLKLDRNPNPHQSFGGGGIHACLGAALGRQILKHTLGEVRRQLTDVRLGKPEYMLSNFMQGVMRLPATWKATQS